MSSSLIQLTLPCTQENAGGILQSFIAWCSDRGYRHVYQMASLDADYQSYYVDKISYTQDKIICVVSKNNVVMQNIKYSWINNLDRLCILQSKFKRGYENSIRIPINILYDVMDWIEEMDEDGEYYHIHYDDNRRYISFKDSKYEALYKMRFL